MSMKQQMELLLSLRQLQCIKFWNNDDYFLRFHVLSRSPDFSKLRSAYPCLSKSPKPCSTQRRQAKTYIEKKHGYFQSQIFKVYFLDQCIKLNDCCLFRLENDWNSQQNMSFEIHLELFLVRNFKDGASKNCEPERQILMFATTLLIRRSVNKEMSQFLNVRLTNIESYGTLSLHVATASLGYKIRKHELSLCELLSLPLKERQAIFNSTHSRIQTKREGGKLIRKLIGRKQTQLNLFQIVTISKLQYRWISKLCKKLPIDPSNMTAELLSPDYLDSKPASSLKQLQHNYQTENDDEILFEIFKEHCAVSMNCKAMWHSYCRMLKLVHTASFVELCKDYTWQLESQWQQIQIKVMTDSQRKQQIEVYKNERQSLLLTKTIYSQEDLARPMVLTSNYSPFLLHPSKGSRTLLVLVHGYKGSHIDLVNASNHMIDYNPNVTIFIIKEMVNSDCLQKLGLSAAKNIKDYLELSKPQFERISFVGYSLGGIIIREALKHLSAYKQQMNILITLSCPHMGLIETKNRLVKFGTCFLSQMKGMKIIHQIISHKAGQKVQGNYIDKLSEQPHLNWFKKVVLVASEDDEYIPHSSACLQTSPQDRMHHSTRKLIENMPRIERVEVWFDDRARGNRLDKIIGRQSHIEFVDNGYFLDLLFSLYARQL